MEAGFARQIAEKLTSARQVLLVMHRRPDPDAMGSAAAMAEFLKIHKIPYRYFCATALPDEAALFGINPNSVLGYAEKPRLNDFSVICVFDSGDIEHAGLNTIIPADPAPSPIINKLFIINIDHHATNTNFGDINIIRPHASSTTEIIYCFFKKLRFPVSPRAAAYLLAGLLTDTDTFHNPATSASSLEIAGALIARGVSLPRLRALLFERRGISALKIIGEALTRLRQNPRLKIAMTYITEADLKKYRVSFEEIEGIANILNSIDGARAMLFLKEKDGFVRGSLRTTRDGINVGRLAEFLGGGGHLKAAGFGIKGRLQIEGRCVKIL